MNEHFSVKIIIPRKKIFFCFTYSILQNIMVNNHFNNANRLSIITNLNFFKVHIILSQFETCEKF